MADLVYVMATLKELAAAGVDTAGIRTNGEYGIKHINLIPAEVFNKIRWDNNFLMLTQADTDKGMIEKTVATWKESVKVADTAKTLTDLRTAIENYGKEPITPK